MNSVDPRAGTAAMVATVKTQSPLLLIVPMLHQDDEGNTFWCGEYGMRTKGIDAEGDGEDFIKTVLTHVLETLGTDE